MPVPLPCPFCNQPYVFHHDAVSVCPSCELEIAPRCEETPRIQSKRLPRWVYWTLGPTCFVGLFLFPPYGAAFSFTLFLGLLFCSGSEGDRCGHCGAELRHPHAKSCLTCWSELEGFVS